MNQSAIDQAEEDYFRVCHENEVREREAWERYDRLSKGKPVDFKPANPVPQAGQKLGPPKVTTALGVGLAGGRR